MGLVRGHTGCELFDVVVSVPLWQLVQPGVHGVVLLDAGGVDETVHVSVPRLQSQFRRPHRHIVAHLLGHRLKALIVRVFLAIFGHARHQVLAHLEVLVQEDFRLHHLNRIDGDALQRLDLVLLHIVLLQGHRIDDLEALLQQQRVGVQGRMLHRHTLCVGEGNALFQAERRNLHQQRLQTVFVGQFEIVAQHGVDDELPFQSIGALDGASGHQPVALAGDVNGLRLSMFLGVCVERTGLRIKAHLRVGTHIDRPVKSWLQILYLKPELVHIRPSRRLIQIQVELPDLLLSLG